MVILTFYGAVGEIGGNIVCVEDPHQASRVLLDFGKSYSQLSRYYSFPQRPRGSVELELIKTGIVPQIRCGGKPVDLYAELEASEVAKPGKQRQTSPSERRRRNVEYRIREPKGGSCVTDLFLSHVHTDHAGLATILRGDIRINLGKAAHVLFKTRYEATSRASLEAKLYQTEEALNAGDATCAPRHTYRAFRTGENLQPLEGAVEIQPLAVDHSIPGAYAYLLHTSVGPIVYTGDFRTHGPASILTQRALAHVKEEGRPAALIAEGTNVGESRVFSESDVKNAATALINQSLTLGTRLVLVEVPQADVDRVRTFCEVAAELDLKPLVCMRVANYLHELAPLERTFVPTSVPLPRIGRHVGIYVERRNPRYRTRLFARLQERYEDFMVDAETVRHSSRERYLIIDANEIDLFNLKPHPGSLCILSTCEPFNEEMEFDFERWKNQLALFGVHLYHIHASGHIRPLDLVKFIEEINPKTLIPIHTEHPEFFVEIFRNRGMEVKVPQKGIPIILE